MASQVLTFWGDVASEAWSLCGVGKGSVTGPMMGGLRVAPRTLSVECRLPLGKGDPPRGLPSPYRRYDGQHYIRAGRRPEPQSGFLGTGGGRWLNGWWKGLMIIKVINVFSQDRVQQRFVLIFSSSCRVRTFQLCNGDGVQRCARFLRLWRRWMGFFAVFPHFSRSSWLSRS